MRVLRQLGVLVLLLVSCLAPAMACMVPNAQMSTQERACCRMMKNQCGQMEMPASHGCCQKAPPSVHDNALDTKPMTFHPVVVPVIWLAASEMEHPYERGLFVDRHGCADHHMFCLRADASGEPAHTLVSASSRGRGKQSTNFRS